MDRPSTSGSIRRARERAEAGLPREDFSTFVQRQGMDQPSVAQQSIPRRPPPGPSNAGQSRIPRLQAPPGLQTKDGQIGIPISRPAPIAQWPLAGPLMSPADSSDAEPYRPPPGRSQPPQRPPRPSRVPSILDGSRIQDHTPSFQYTPQNVRESDGNLSAVPETPSSVSRPSTLSSLASIPDFPLPVQMPPPPPVAPPRRSVNLGPPPSARRGASSFYSNASFVSPIPEESPRSRSHASFASSAAMPESWGTPSPGPSPQYPEAYLDDSTVDESAQSPYDEEGDESRLVRSASIGKRAKASLVTTTSSKALEAGDMPPRPGPSPMQPGPFNDGTGYLDYSSSSSSTVPTTRTPVGAALTADAILSAYDAATASDPSNPSRRMSVSPQPPGSRPYSRLSAIRRPPKLDIDAVRKAESRGSLTSLPDLIRRATRLAASLERGKRPASRFDDLTDFPGVYDGGRDGEKEYSSQSRSSKEIPNKLLIQNTDEYEKHQSGLSDMLAAFPPPAQPINQRRSFRQSLRDQVGSWPLPAAFNRSQSSLPNSQSERRPGVSQEPKKQGRRCCGLPLWGFLLILLVVLIIIAAAVVIPLEFFVIRKQNADQDAQSALQQCQNQLICANGGTNVVNQGICSCICTNGFTGFDCTVAGADGCTTANLAGETNINNVTLGNAIPRLVQQATNFSIALSGTQILAKFNTGNLSCGAENALVTFDGQSTRQGAANAVVVDPENTNNVASGPDVVNGVAIVTVMVMAGQSTTVTVDVPTYSRSGDALQTANGAGTFSTIFGTTISYPPAETTVPSTTTTTVTITPPTSAPSSTSTPTDSFMVTEEVLDFARVAVLFVLQEETLSNAESAQNAMQRFFTSASNSYLGTGSSVTPDQARNVSLGNGNTIDLVSLSIDVGQGTVGGTGSQAARLRFRDRRLVPFVE